MIKKLQKNISLLLFLLLGIVLIGVLAWYNWVNYEGNLRELRMEVRQEISDMGWSEFIRSGGEAPDLDIAYSFFRIRENGSVILCTNRYPQMEEKKQYAYAEQIANDWKEGKQFLRVTYISKDETRFGNYGKYVILISGHEALRDSMSTILASMGLAVLGIVVLLAITHILSRRLVWPVDQMINSEKKFMSNASHELKTPLTVISANAQLLAEEIGDNNRHLNYIRQETERMISMVNKMLTLMHLDTPFDLTEHRRFCVDEALLAVIYPMESVAYEKKLRMIPDIQEQMYIMGDEEQIKNVMSILLDNAISYTPEGGTITIRAALRARKFSLSVSNSGEPIPQEQQDKLFERFFRMDEARRDTDGHFGLGLYIAGSIVANHHGKIWVESRDGQNIFHVVLPAGK